MSKKNDEINVQLGWKEMRKKFHDLDSPKTQTATVDEHGQIVKYKFPELLERIMHDRHIVVESDIISEFCDFCRNKGINVSGGIIFGPSEENNPLPGKFSQCVYIG